MGGHRDENPPRSGSPRATADIAETELLERARLGDVPAYSELVRRHQDPVFGLVLRLVRDFEAAEEVTQDVFVKAFRGLGTFRGDAKFSTWLYRIAVNLCHDHRMSLAARMRRAQTSLDDPESGAPDIPARNAGPDGVVSEGQAVRDFAAALDAMDDSYREAFLLRHQEGMGYAEIAEVLGITQGNAKVRVHRARETILEALRRRGHEV